jgi:hypothetical protein
MDNTHSYIYTTLFWDLGLIVAGLGAVREVVWTAHNRSRTLL